MSGLTEIDLPKYGNNCTAQLQSHLDLCRFQQMKQHGHVEGEARKRARDSSDSSDSSDSEREVKRQKVT